MRAFKDVRFFFPFLVFFAIIYSVRGEVDIFVEESRVVIVDGPAEQFVLPGETAVVPVEGGKMSVDLADCENGREIKICSDVAVFFRIMDAPASILPGGSLIFRYSPQKTEKIAINRDNAEVGSPGPFFDERTFVRFLAPGTDVTGIPEKSTVASPYLSGIKPMLAGLGNAPLSPGILPLDDEDVPEAGAAFAPPPPSIAKQIEEMIVAAKDSARTNGDGDPLLDTSLREAGGSPIKVGEGHQTSLSVASKKNESIPADTPSVLDDAKNYAISPDKPTHENNSNLTKPPLIPTVTPLNVAKLQPPPTAEIPLENNHCLPMPSPIPSVTSINVATLPDPPKDKPSLSVAKAEPSSVKTSEAPDRVAQKESDMVGNVSRSKKLQAKATEKHVEELGHTSKKQSSNFPVVSLSIDKINSLSTDGIITSFSPAPKFLTLLPTSDKPDLLRLDPVEEKEKTTLATSSPENRNTNFSDQASTNRNVAAPLDQIVAANKTPQDITVKSSENKLSVSSVNVGKVAAYVGDVRLDVHSDGTTIVPPVSAIRSKSDPIDLSVPINDFVVTVVQHAVEGGGWQEAPTYIVSE